MKALLNNLQGIAELQNLLWKKLLNCPLNEHNSNRILNNLDLRVQILLDVSPVLVALARRRRRRLEAEVVVEVVVGLGGNAVHVDRVVAHEVLLQKFNV